MIVRYATKLDPRHRCRGIGRVDPESLAVQAAYIACSQRDWVILTACGRNDRLRDGRLSKRPVEAVAVVSDPEGIVVVWCKKARWYDVQQPKMLVDCCVAPNIGWAVMRTSPNVDAHRYELEKLKKLHSEFVSPLVVLANALESKP